jgi:hypothetical protein
VLRGLSSPGAGLLTLIVVACSDATTATAPPVTDDGSSAHDAGAEEEAPARVAFTADEVQDLFNVRCVRCHAGNHPVLDLSGSFAERTIGVSTSTGMGAECEDSKYGVLIVAGDREASLLWHKVNGTQDCGDVMPPVGKGALLGAVDLERLGLFIDGLAR